MFCFFFPNHALPSVRHPPLQGGGGPFWLCRRWRRLSQPAVSFTPRRERRSASVAWSFSCARSAPSGTPRLGARAPWRVHQSGRRRLASASLRVRNARRCRQERPPFAARRAPPPPVSRDPKGLTPCRLAFDSRSCQQRVTFTWGLKPNTLLSLFRKKCRFLVGSRRTSRLRGRVSTAWLSQTQRRPLPGERVT